MVVLIESVSECVCVRERRGREEEASFFDDKLQSRRENRVIDLTSASRKRNVLHTRRRELFL
jgi:hypothetical protein